RAAARGTYATSSHWRVLPHRTYDVLFGLAEVMVNCGAASGEPLVAVQVGVRTVAEPLEPVLGARVREASRARDRVARGVAAGRVQAHPRTPHPTVVGRAQRVRDREPERLGHEAASARVRMRPVAD